MARRMGKTADDQYMGSGTGNWKGAPKAPAKKTRGVATTEAVKKMKQKESSMAKPKPKPSKPAMSGASRSTANKVSAKSGASRSTSGKVSAKSGAARSVKAKVDNSIGARLVRGAKRLFGNKQTRLSTGNPNFKAKRPR